MKSRTYWARRRSRCRYKYSPKLLKKRAIVANCKRARSLTPYPPFPMMKAVIGHASLVIVWQLPWGSDERPTSNAILGFMRIAYLDCFSGISGDMFLGALVDVGLPGKLLEDTVAALNIGARLEVSRLSRSGIAATKVDVYAHGEKELPREI